MASYHLDPLYVVNKIASEALAAYRIVIISTDQTTCEYPAGSTDTQLMGITLHSAASGENVDICVFGPCLLEVNGNSTNIGWGDPVGAPTDAGIGAHLAATADLTSEYIGRAWGSSTADGDVIPVFVAHGWFASESS